MLNLLFCKNNLFLPFFQGFSGDFCRFSKVILLVFAVFPRFFGRFLPFFQDFGGWQIRGEMLIRALSWRDFSLMAAPFGVILGMMFCRGCSEAVSDQPLTCGSS
ncbi:hypothetical protein [Duncaniella muris]|uniref:hypothetical protein n=1 Tax=Duncaniella muris TaxID=2094150 RepID=UPI0027148E77|nr:hypothetical protein [Duncaniella muris]